MNTRKIDVSLLITFHSEGILAQMTLNSVERCRLYAEQHGISCEYVWVMDNIDDETKRILNEYPIDSSIVQKIEVSHGDSGASRNSGITIAKGTAIITGTAWVDEDGNGQKGDNEKSLSGIKVRLYKCNYHERNQSLGSYLNSY